MESKQKCQRVLGSEIQRVGAGGERPVPPPGMCGFGFFLVGGARRSSVGVSSGFSGGSGASGACRGRA